MPRPGGGRARSSGGGERHRGGERFLRGLRLRRRGGERPARGLRLRRRGGERRRLPAGLRLRLRLRLRRLRRGGGLRSRLRERPSRRSRPSSSLPGVTRRRGGGLPRSRGSDPLLLEPLRGLCVRADTRVSEDTRASRWVCVATGRKADITSAMASPRSHQDLRASRLPRSLPLLRLLWRCCVPHRMLVRKVVAGLLRTRVGARLSRGQGPQAPAPQQCSAGYSPRRTRTRRRARRVPAPTPTAHGNLAQTRSSGARGSSSRHLPFATATGASPPPAP